jgi:hypothetical protein
MTTIRYQDGIPHVVADEITESSATSVSLSLSSSPTTLCDATSNPITVYLPLASTCEGNIYTVKKVDSSSNAVTVSRSGSDLIDGQTSVTIADQYVSISFQSNGTEWFIYDMDSDRNLIEDETSARLEADSSIYTIVTSTSAEAEASLRIEADSSLYSVLDIETSTRFEVDCSLYAALDLETSTRFEVDCSLYAALDLETSTRFEVDCSLYAAIESEASTREEIDSSLQANITAITIISYEVTSSASINSNEEIFADTTSGPITLTLPASPVQGNRVKVMDAKGTWDSTNKCVIARNGNMIAGYASDLELTVPNDSVELVFYTTTSDWRMV